METIKFILNDKPVSIAVDGDRPAVGGTGLRRPPRGFERQSQIVPRLAEARQAWTEFFGAGAPWQ